MLSLASLSVTSVKVLKRLITFSPLALSLITALLIASGLLLALNTNPLEAYSSMLQGAFGTENATAETLVKAIPILLVAIGVCVAFRGGVVNIGGEGQMIAGAIAGTTVALALSQAPGLVIIVGSLITGFLAGALYGGLAGFLKAYFGVNEILSTIMLNQIAVQLMNFLLNGPLLDPAVAGSNNIPKTARIVEAAELPRLSISLFGSVLVFDKTRLHYGLVLAIALAIIIYVLLWYTTIGYRIRAVGQNERAARYAGISVKRQMILSMFLAGGFAGIAGIVQVLGLQYRLQTDGSPAGFTGGAGFNGIVAALFGGLNPLGAIPASTFFGGLLVGAQKMQRDLGIPASLITAINGLIVIFVVSSQIFAKRLVRQQLLSDSQPEQAPVSLPAPSQQEKAL
jgi:general nucleoside transport system permease protein